MRNIVFRGKLKNKAEYKTNQDAIDGWIYGDLIKTYNDGAIQYNIYNKGEINKDTIGQGTTFFDKNGVHIFEGDIINIDDKFLRAVVYSDKHGAFCTMRIKNGKNEITGILGEGYVNYNKSYKVVGNIHDCPELKDKLF